MNKAEREIKPKKIEEKYENLIRILDKDISGNKGVIVGLRKIKGVSWAISNAICNSLNIPHQKKISELTKDEIKKIEDFLKNPKLPSFLLNRRKDLDTGENKHLTSSSLELRKD